MQWPVWAYLTHIWDLGAKPEIWPQNRRASHYMSRSKQRLITARRPSHAGVLLQHHHVPAAAQRHLNYHAYASSARRIATSGMVGTKSKVLSLSHTGDSTSWSSQLGVVEHQAEATTRRAAAARLSTGGTPVSNPCTSTQHAPLRTCMSAARPSPGHNDASATANAPCFLLPTFISLYTTTKKAASPQQTGHPLPHLRLLL